MMTDNEKREHAQRIAREHLRDFEFLSVVEDWKLEDASEEDQLAIHDLITNATLTLNQ